MTRYKEEIAKRDLLIQNLREENNRMKSILEIFADNNSYVGDGIPIRPEYLANYGLKGWTEPRPIKIRKHKSIFNKVGLRA